LLKQVVVSGKGQSTATSAHAIVSEALLSSITPQQGSIHGGTTVTLQGHGFKANTTVTFGADACLVVLETATSVVCLTSQGSGPVIVTVVSNSVTFPTTTFTFTTAATPTVTSTNPAVGQSGDSISIIGTGFSTTASDNEVSIDGAVATVTSASSTSLTVTLGDQLTGSFPVVVTVRGLGLSNADVNFQYTLGSITFSPDTGMMALAIQ
jgi:hypothetical protein